MKSNCMYLCLLLTFGGCFNFQAQEIKIFTLHDFDLIDSVKTNLVVTKYGKEEYNFNPDGRLAKSKTKYNDTDYSITYYKYDGPYLIEKRFENYRENTFDANTSIANFYTIDSISNKKITEKIISYTKEFLEQYEYVYNEENVLQKIIRTNDNGIDKTDITYDHYKGEDTKTYLLNGEILKSIRTSNGKGKNKGLKIVLTKTYLKGKPVSAVEEVCDMEGGLISETTFEHSTQSKQFEVQQVKRFYYDEKNILSKTETTIGKETITKSYIYQFDNGETGNWVKEIVTPDNTYTTREISYY
ncbi:hypothetical protein [uncultured Maribacter sp.]|uniref:hypothetical protein n=1 Tax=uncultured Maribacter sp. TaxID=431308 RepID=UPI0026135188|nr:hypothetical protein [uncultured Maribacter sp.]